MPRPPANKPKLDLSRIGTPGLPVWHGRVYDEILNDLQGEKGRRILREMSEQDPIIGGTLFGIEMLARQVPWTVIPASLKGENDSEEFKNKAKEVADFVDGCLSDMSPSFGSSLSEILSMLIYGWSWQEILYKRREGLVPGNNRKSSRFDDGKIGWAGWAIRSQETLDYWMYEDDDPAKYLIGMRQMGAPDYKPHEIPRSKSLHFTTRSRRENPEGISILRNCYRPWYMKKNIEAIEGIGIERDLAGLPVLWAPIELFGEDADDDQKALFRTLQDIVTSIKRDEQEGILMPQQYDAETKEPLYKLELLSTAGERQFDTNAIINRYDERIAMSMLADFILMGHQAVGSFALSTTKTGMFTTALSAIMDVIAEEINLSGIPTLVLLNGWSLDLVPTLQHGKIEAADLSKLGDFIKQLSDSGMQMFPNAKLEKHLRDLAGLPGDQGAGELPLPVDEDGNPDTDALLKLLPPGTQLPPPTTDPAVPPTGGPPPAPAAQPPRAQPRARPVARVATEPKKISKHFTPLPVRLGKLAEQLKSTLEPEQYSELLEAAMEAGSFTKLSLEHRTYILEAEQAS